MHSGIAEADSKRDRREEKHQAPHAITNSSKIYWHQSLDLVK